MPTFKSLNDIERYIQEKINDVLVNEVAEDIAFVESEVIIDNVYSKYNPEMYDRRGLGGGFADPGNIEGTLVADGELVVENVTPFNPGYETANSGSGLAGLIEYGDGYQGHTYDYYPKNKPATYAEPRPFMEDTRDIVKRGLKHTIATALEDRGLEVKI